MGDFDLNKSLEAFKRQFMDLVRDLHARKLALPAGLLLAAIVAAVVMLPKGAAPVAAPATAVTPSPTAPTQKVELAQITLLKSATLDDDIPLANTRNPMIGEDDYSCTTVRSSPIPKLLDCRIGDILVRVVCPPNNEAQGVCGSTSGSTGGTGGATGTAGGSGTGTGTGTGTGGGTGSSGSTGGIKYYTWAVTVKIDLKTYKNKVIGSQLPTQDNPLAIFAGVNTDDGAVFLGASGVAVTGTPVDPNFNRFDLKKGQTATITDLDGKKHKLTLVSIKKVEKS